MISLNVICKNRSNFAAKKLRNSAAPQYGDEQVNVTNITLIMKHILGSDGESFIIGNADVNSDGWAGENHLSIKSRRTVIKNEHQLKENNLK